MVTRRLLTVVLVVAAVVAAGPGAGAKMPAFHLDVPEAPAIVGVPYAITLTVGVVGPTGPLAALVEARPPAGAGAATIDLLFEQVGADRWVAEPEFPVEGVWKLISFPDVEDRSIIARIYPDNIELQVVAEPGPPAATALERGTASRLRVPAVMGVVLAAVVVLRRRRYAVARSE